jgi:hypothetical protein
LEDGAEAAVKTLRNRAQIFEQEPD